MMHTISGLTAFSTITMLMMLRGAGIGLGLMPVMNASMSVVSKPLVGRASALINVSKQIFASFGIAMLTTVMQNRQVYHYSELAHSINKSSPAFSSIQHALSGIASQLGIGARAGGTLSISLIYGHVATLAAVQAIDDCFLISAARVRNSNGLVFFLERQKNRRHSRSSTRGRSVLVAYRRYHRL